MKTSLKFYSLSAILFFTLLAQVALGQDYKALKTNAEYFFVDSSSRDIIAMRIDSIRIFGNDTYYYNFKQVRPVDNGCYTIGGSSWLGDQVVEKSNGVFVFTVNPASPPDSVHIYYIHTRSEINQPWLFYHFHIDNEYIEARLSEIKLMSFLELTDSVRVISLTRKDAAGQIIEDQVNTQKILLSKNYGLIRLVKFDEIPYYDLYKFYDLVGKTNPETGITNLKTQQIYDFEPGDEFHSVYFSRSYPIPSFITQISTINRVLERINYPSADSVSYRIERCQSSSYENYLSDLSYSYNFDTIIQTYSPTHTPEFETEPLESVLFPSNPEMATYTFMGLMVFDTRLPIYDVPYKSLQPQLWWYNNNDCYTQVIYDGCYNSNYYFKGLGGPYYYCNDFLWGPNNMLVYYKKGPKTWGTPLSCDSLSQVGMKENIKYSNLIRLTPNPTAGIITCTTPSNHPLGELEFYDLSGRLVAKLKQQQSTQSYDISWLPAGLYVYIFYSSNGAVFHGKLIRQ